jgi:hypothetical protein
VPRDDNPVVELRAKLGAITGWKNNHSRIARALYMVILETLNLASTNGGLEKQTWLDVEVEIDGRHMLCEHARKRVWCLSN